MLRAGSLTCCSNGARVRCYASHMSGFGVPSKRVIAVGAVTVILVTFTVMSNYSFAVRKPLEELLHSEHMASVLPPSNPQTDLSDMSLTYAIVFDCGSSGTRVYLYCWPPHSGDSSDLLDIRPVTDSLGKPVSKKVSPGLSAYANKPADAAEYLFPLLDMAGSIVPKEKHKQTPLFVLATAGMRLIPAELADQIIDDIVVDIPLKYDFIFLKSHVEIISGKQEGVYAWISLNYLLGRFHHSHANSDEEKVPLFASHDSNSSLWHARKQTVGVIDMGGGSVQIAFEMPADETAQHQEVISELNLGCQESDKEHRYRLYVTTHLGYGANIATQRYRDALVAPAAEQAKAVRSAAEPKGPVAVDDPCLPLDLVDEYDAFLLRGTGNFSECRRLLLPLLNKTDGCKLEMHCSVNGVFQPIIPRFWSFYGISEYWYSLHDVFDMAGGYNSESAMAAAETYCSTPWSQTLKRQADGAYPYADMSRLKSECFKAGWIMTVLHDGFRFPKNHTNFMPVNEINDQEVQWTLGSLIYKTRYYPMSPLHRTHEGISKWAVQLRVVLPYAAIVCFLIVLAAIMQYCRHLKVVPSALHHTVPSSMGYFSGSEYEMEEAVSKSTYKLV